MLCEEQLLELLWGEAKQQSQNAATLTHNIGVAFRYLETPWGDKAKQIIGALITLNAGSMHTTIWAALFQQLRETDKLTIKVYILKQFANVCWTVPTTQTENAFRAFAIEVRPMLADIQVVVNATFQKSFIITIKFFRSFAEKRLSSELFDTLYRDLTEWKRSDGLRAAASVIAIMADENPGCPPPEQLLFQARHELECFTLAILLDALVSLEVAPGRILDKQRIAAFCDELDGIIEKILAAPQLNEKVVPLCVNAYRRLKQVRHSWEPAAVKPFTHLILNALAQTKTNKLLFCPFLHFLQETSYSWWQSSNILWLLTDSGDPFVRADAYAALATTIRVIDASEQRLLLADLIEKLRFSIEEQCSCTTVAILKFVKRLLLHTHFPPTTEELYLLKLLHLCRRHGKGLHHDVPAQLELLNLFLCVNVASDSLVVFARELFLVSPHRMVAERAFYVLCRFSRQMFLDSGMLTSGQYNNDSDYLEAVTQVRHEEPFESELISSIFINRAKGLFSCMYARLCTFAENEAKQHASCIIVCDAVKELCATTAVDVLCNVFFKHTMLSLLSELLVSQDAIPSDVYVSLVQACAACLHGSDPDICEDAHLLSTLVQHSWGVIVACATALFSSLAPAPVSPSWRFFRTDSLSQACHDLILTCRDIVLSNEVAFYDTIFHEILSSNIQLLTSCISLLRNAPIFVAELRDSVCYWLECCIALSFCVPKWVLRLLTVVLEVATVGLHRRPQRAETTQCLLLSVVRTCHRMVKQVINMDFLLCCQEICEFLLFFVLQDAEDEGFLFRELIANNWTLVLDLFSFCERIVIRLHSDNAADAFAAVLDVLLALCDSVYSSQLTCVIPHCSFEALLQALHKTAYFSQKRHCLRVISRILAAFDTNESIEGELHNCFSGNSNDIDFFERFDRFVELWNASSAQAQDHFKAMLGSSHRVENLVCAAAVDEQCIPKAVEAALVTSVAREVLGVLLIIVREAKAETLSPLLFVVSDAVFGESDGLLKAIICSYRWGWYGGQQTIQMLSCGVWRTLNTSLSLHLKLLSEVFQKDRSECVRCERCLRVANECASSLSFWQLCLGETSAEMLPHETEKSFSAIRLAEVLQLRNTSVLECIRLFCDHESNIGTAFCFSNIRLLGAFFSTGIVCKMPSWDPLPLLRLLHLCVRDAKDSPVESELSEWLQLSCWLLFDQVLLSSAPQTIDVVNGKQSAEALMSVELATVLIQLSNLFFCSTAKSVEDVAICVVRYAMRNATVFTMGDISERLFWMIVRHCIYEVWTAITAETVVPMRDPEMVAFLCRAHVKVGLPLSVQREIHALFTPQLLLYGNTGSEFEDDSLRCVLWLVGNFASNDVQPSVYRGASSLLRASESTDTADSGAKPSGRQMLKSLPVAEHNLSQDDARSLSVAIHRVTAQLAQRVLSNTAGATPTNVLDALDVLCNLARHASAKTRHPARLLSNDVGLGQVYRTACDFMETFPLLSADASLDPPSHCLNYLLGQLPRERRTNNIPDALCLNIMVSLLSILLQAWLQESAADSAPPAQLPCALALHLPYLLRSDLPSYICALQCLRNLSVRGAAPEVKAIYDVALPRLMEDLVDARWGAVVSGCWYEVLVDCLGCVPGALRDGDRQLSRRIWEGLWRGAGSIELSCNQHLSERVQQSLQQVIKGLTLESAQWELCRLVVLDSGLQRRRMVATPVATSTFLTEPSVEVYFWLARELQERTWRSLLLQTQSAFVHHGAAVLNADSSRSLAFEFEKAVVLVHESPNERGEFATGKEVVCIVAERVRDSLFSTTDAVLAALNRFDFSGIIQRRSVLHELAKMMVRSSNVSQTSDSSNPSWAEVYFDVLYERAAWHDEGLWVACALATAAAGKTQLSWSKRVLASLIPASSSAWKRELMRRIAQRAKISGAQQEARQFFADASERLSALQRPPPLWKRELLAAVLFVFSS
ncbi:hypothetical protein NXY56_006788 [Leishmania guyanensis]